MMSETVAPDRRAHQRCVLRLPLECAFEQAGQRCVVRTVSTDVSSGGVAFEADGRGIEPGVMLDLTFLVPPGEGHFPYPGQVRGRGRVVRVDRRPEAPANGDSAVRRDTVAACFLEPLQLQF